MDQLQYQLCCDWAADLDYEYDRHLLLLVRGRIIGLMREWDGTFDYM